jgi:alpha-N-arabinofuranosidase
VSAPSDIQLTIAADQPLGRIPRELYGHFAEHLGRCIYEGIWVGPDSPIPNTRGIRNDVLDALRQLAIPVLRWPGGCFADDYHWRDGIGPHEQRRATLNPTWGGVVESNHFGTHEFMDLVELLGCDAYIAGNVGSGTVREMSDWIEYLTSEADTTLVRERQANGRSEPWRIRYFGVGNENWICGGNMRPEYYADEYRRYQTYVRNLRPDRPIYRIACGANSEDYRWTEVRMERAGDHFEGLSLHYYTVPTGDWTVKGPATNFGEDQWFATIKRAARMDEIITGHSEIMDRFDPAQRVGLIIDEWGTWYDVEPGTHPRFLYQQNTLRDALIAAQHFHIFHRHAKRVHMANIAQTVNVLQAMILTDGPRMLRTPTFHLFDLFQAHQGATSLPVTLSSIPEYRYQDQALPAIDASASRDHHGQTHLSLINFDPHTDHTLTLQLSGDSSLGPISGQILTAATINTHNTFDHPDTVVPVPFDQAKLNSDHTLTLTIPAKSIILLSLN